MPHASVQQRPKISLASYASTALFLNVSDTPEWYQAIWWCACSGRQLCKKRAVFSVSAHKLQ